MTLFEFFFEQTNSWEIRENELLGVSFQVENDFNEFHDMFHPIYFLKDRDKNSILRFLNTQKEEFIKREGEFDTEEYKKFIIHSFLIEEIEQYLEAIQKSKCGIYHQEANTNFLWFKLQLDEINQTLILSNKSITQIKLYFKSVLKTIELYYDKEYEKPAFLKPEEASHSGFHSIFFTKQSDKLRLFKRELVNSGLIARDTKLGVLSKSFTGENLEEKIKWIGKQNQLKYLINQLTEEGIINENERKWITASNCFVKKDGSAIKHLNLKGAVDPISSNQHIIDEIVRRLNR